MNAGSFRRQCKKAKRNTPRTTNKAVARQTALNIEAIVRSYPVPNMKVVDKRDESA